MPRRTRPTRKDGTPFNFERFPNKANRLQQTLKDPSKKEKALAVMNVASAGLQTNLGEDESPSKLLISIVDAGADADGVEIIQDFGLLLDDLLVAAMDNIDTPESLPFIATGIVGMWFGELKDDIDAVKD